MASETGSLLPIAQALRLLSQDLSLPKDGGVTRDYVEGDNFVRVTPYDDDQTTTTQRYVTTPALPETLNAETPLGPNVLLVEDDVELARAIARILRRDGLETTVAHSCREAMGMPGYFQNGIFDLHLPDGDGVELAERLRTRVRHAIFYSSTGEVSAMRRAGHRGQFVSKVEGIDGLRGALLWSVARPFERDA